MRQPGKPATESPTLHQPIGTAHQTHSCPQRSITCPYHLLNPPTRRRTLSKQTSLKYHHLIYNRSTITRAATQRSATASVHPPALSEHLILLHHCHWSHMPLNSNSSPAKVCTCTCVPTGRGNKLSPPARNHSMLMLFTTSQAGTSSATAQCYLGTERYQKAGNPVNAAQYICLIGQATAARTTCERNGEILRASCRKTVCTSQ